MQNGKKWLFYSGGFLLMLAGFYFFLFRGTDNWKSKLPVISYVKPFSFINQDGDTITQDKTAGKVYIANYFFVTCTGICPVMNSNVHDVYDALQDEKDLLILSHTCQPEVDTVPLLKHYADSIGVDTKRWQFLTGNKLDLYKIARDSYKIDDPQNNVGDIDDQFLHSQFLALVDKRGQVRGVYDGLKKKEVNQLIVDYRAVAAESGSGNFVNNLFGNTPAR
jgi:protein SCO1/2